MWSGYGQAGGGGKAERWMAERRGSRMRFRSEMLCLLSKAAMQVVQATRNGFVSRCMPYIFDRCWTSDVVPPCHGSQWTPTIPLLNLLIQIGGYWNRSKLRVRTFDHRFGGSGRSSLQPPKNALKWKNCWLVEPPPCPTLKSSKLVEVKCGGVFRDWRKAGRVAGAPWMVR